jgi:hypothetical protein
MHMLHTRRKAEIEIISTVAKKPQQRQVEVLHSTSMSVNLSKNGPASHPLLDYLLDKILDFVDFVDVDA